MIFRQILHADLGCASYLVASHGDAAVIDPQWDIDPLLEVAAAARVEIRHVLETHFHADHVSGRRRLVTATGATPRMPADPQRPSAGGLRDGDVLRVGSVTVTVIGAPGHRPEHLAYLVADSDAEDRPPLLLSGDSLLVGELARPDLAVEATEGARALWRTVRRLTALGDAVELWPGHVGASLCASGALGDRTCSTIGEERRHSPLLALGDEASFVAELTRAIPARPPRVARVVALNLEGARDLGPVRELDANGLAAFIARGAVVLDIRPADLFDEGHLPGALNLPEGGPGLGTRVGWATADDEAVAIVAATRESACRVARLLYAAGVWAIAGVSVADPAGWARAGLEIRRSVALEPSGLVGLLADGARQLVDVRDDREWRAGHVRGSVHLPLPVLGDGRTAPLADRGPVAVACASGRRAALAASVLRRGGHHDVARVRGGVGDLAGWGVALVTGEP